MVREKLACRSSADGWHDVDHDQFIELVAVEVRMVPALARADLMEPEGSVRVIRADDAPDWAWFVEVAHEAGEADAEPEALDE